MIGGSLPPSAFVLVLAHADDEVAAAVVDAVGARDVPVVVLGPSAPTEVRWAHRREDGRTATVLGLPGGPELDLRACLGVLHRLHWVWPGGFPAPSDAEYAACEVQALLTSVLAAAPCPVVHRPTAAVANGLWSPAAWLAFAGAFEVPCARLRLTTSGRRFPGDGFRATDWTVPTTSATVGLDPWDPAVTVGDRPVAWMEPVDVDSRVVVVGDHILGAPDDAWEGHCRRLAVASGASVLEVVLGTTAEGHRVLAHVDAYPRMLNGNAIAALAELLCGASAGVRA